MAMKRKYSANVLQQEEEAEREEVEKFEKSDRDEKAAAKKKTRKASVHSQLER